MLTVPQALALAVQQHQVGQLRQAEQIYRAVLEADPHQVDALHLLGVLTYQLGHYEQASVYMSRAVRLRPEFAEGHINLAAVLQAQGKLADARACYEQALRLRPDAAEAHNNLGNVLKEQGQVAEAQTHYEHALRLKPDFPEANNNLGTLLQEQGQWDAARAAYEAALRHKPDYAEAHVNLGNVHKDQGNLTEARACFERALHLRPDLAEAHYNLGNVLKEDGQIAAACACFHEALRLQPNFAKAHAGLGLAWLLAGNFEQGWPEYEWRWQCKEFTPPRFRQPLWDGSPLDGRTILLLAEQGLGDTLQFVRYAPLVQARGGRVVFACQPALLPLLRSCPGIDHLVAVGGSLPPFAVYAPLLSVPRILGTTLATVPVPVPYLRADAQLLDHWRQEFRSVAAFKIGIAWDADARFRALNYRRCIPLAEFAPLAQLKGVRLFSLQKGPGVEQLRRLAGRFAVTDLSSRLDETSGAFMDTAAVMQSLDLIVTADISIAHLAGALGVPVWVALPSAPDWRWLLEREDCPWYPSMRLFRQKEWGNWREVFERMAATLQRHLER